MHLSCGRRFATGGFNLFLDRPPTRVVDKTDVLWDFVPPVLNTSTQTNTVSGTTLALVFYCIPTAPGQSKVIITFFTNAKVPAFAAKLASAVGWLFHLVRGAASADWFFSVLCSAGSAALAAVACAAAAAADVPPGEGGCAGMRLPASSGAVPNTITAPRLRCADDLQ
jgi:hypothetical protein